MYDMCFMSQNTYVNFIMQYMFPIHWIPRPILIGLTSLTEMSKSNFTSVFWILILLCLEEKFVTIIDSSSNKEKAHYKAWERSNRLSLMFMRMTVVDSTKTALPKTDNAKEFMRLVETRS